MREHVARALLCGRDEGKGIAGWWTIESVTDRAGPLADETCTVQSERSSSGSPSADEIRGCRQESRNQTSLFRGYPSPLKGTMGPYGFEREAYGDNVPRRMVQGISQ